MTYWDLSFDRMLLSYAYPLYCQFMPNFVLVFAFSVDAHEEQYSDNSFEIGRYFFACQKCCVLTSGVSKGLAVKVLQQLTYTRWAGELKRLNPSLSYLGRSLQSV